MVAASAPAMTQSAMDRIKRKLATAIYATSPEAHELQGVLSTLDESTGVLIVSDMPLSSWKSSVGRAGPRVMVDVTRYEAKARPARAGSKLLFRSSDA